MGLCGGAVWWVYFLLCVRLTDSLTLYSALYPILISPFLPSPLVIYYTVSLPTTLPTTRLSYPLRPTARSALRLTGQSIF